LPRTSLWWPEERKLDIPPAPSWAGAGGRNATNHLLNLPRRRRATFGTLKLARPGSTEGFKLADVESCSTSGCTIGGGGECRGDVYKTSLALPDKCGWSKLYLGGRDSNECNFEELPRMESASLIGTWRVELASAGGGGLWLDLGETERQGADGVPIHINLARRRERTFVKINCAVFFGVLAWIVWS